ncbi:MAG TPA: hypothetical protein VF603_14615 [Allosphingosinicella sp.]|jgi:hypothetical protein
MLPRHPDYWKFQSACAAAGLAIFGGVLLTAGAGTETVGSILRGMIGIGIAAAAALSFCAYWRKL